MYLPQALTLPTLPPSAKTSVLDALLSATAPLALDISVDRLGSVRTLREAVKKRLSAADLAASAGQVLLVESHPGDCSELARILRDQLSVGKLHEDSVIFAYCAPTSRPNHVFIYQVSRAVIKHLPPFTAGNIIVI